MNRFSSIFFGSRSKDQSSERRKGEVDDRSAEAAVLKALHLMARRSSPHKASARASMARAISVIEASMLGLCHIEELVTECHTLCQTGLTSNNQEKRNALSRRYEDVITELNAIAKGTGHAGFNLIGEVGAVFEVELGETNDFKLKLPNINLTAGPQGLALPKPEHAFADVESLKQFDRHLGFVRDRLEKTTAVFKEHGADVTKRLALILEGSYAEKHELKGGPTAPLAPVALSGRA